MLLPDSCSGASIGREEVITSLGSLVTGPILCRSMLYDRAVDGVYGVEKFSAMLPALYISFVRYLMDVAVATKVVLIA